MCTGGNCMVRVEVIQAIGGFNPTIIAGEDTEFCYRIRKNGWKIYHSKALMGTHENKIDNFIDFFKRCMRTGFAYQQLSNIYKGQGLFVKENRSNWILGGLIPIAAILLTPFTYGWSLLLLLTYPLLIARIFFRLHGRWKDKDVLLYACSCAASKIPGFIGACRYWCWRLKN